MKNIALNSIKTLGTIVKIIILSRFYNILKSKHQQKKGCVILGNGPSLTKSLNHYENKFESYDLICVNNFAISEFYTKIKPNYYIVAAPILYQDEQTLSKTYLELRNTLFENIFEKTTWPMEIMVPYIAKKSSYFQDKLKTNHSVKPIYFNQTPVEGIAFFNHFFFNKGWGMPRPHNVLIPSIMNSIKLGYKYIYIIGADHSWLPEISVNNMNEALVHQKHFYDENESKPLKMEDYITRPRRLHEIIHKFYLTFKGYWEINDYANKKNVKIYNASEVSMIDAFERKEIAEI